MDAWLGYTPITSEANANLRRVWKQYSLPAVKFDEWSLEYAREVWSVVAMCTKADSELVRDDLLRLLETMDVWSNDPAERQWTPIQ